MAERKLTYQDAEDIRLIHQELALNPHRIARLCDGVFGVAHTTIQKIVQRRGYYREPLIGEMRGDVEPPCYDGDTLRITCDDNARWFQATRPVCTAHSDAQRTYAAQNERDGYQRGIVDRGWLFYGAAWATDDAMAAD